MSSKHLEISYTDGSWFALDLGSSNGTRLNESQVSMMTGEPHPCMYVGCVCKLRAQHRPVVTIHACLPCCRSIIQAAGQGQAAVGARYVDSGPHTGVHTGAEHFGCHASCSSSPGAFNVCLRERGVAKSDIG